MSQKAIAALNRLTTIASGQGSAQKMTIQQYDRSLVTTLDDLGNLLPDEQALYHRTYKRVFEETRNDVAARQAAVGAVRRFRLDMPVKSMKSGTDWLTKGWGLLYAASPEFVDTDNEYFPRQSQFYLDYFKNAPLWYEHGADPRYGVVPIGWRVEVIEYPTGLYAIHALDKKHPLFEETVENLRAGKLSYSSDSIYHFKMRGQTYDGGLYCWPLAGWSLVRRPAEPGLGNVILVEPEAA
jgi:hypothetical protein